MMEIGPSALREFRRGAGYEWLETDGQGGFAMGTAVGAHTRRYHGLLTAALPAGRVLLLSRIEETLIVNGRSVPLSCNLYRDGTVHPDGHRFLTRFRLNPFPEWTWEVGPVRIVKDCLRLSGGSRVLLRYRVHGPGGSGPPRLLLRPLFACRDLHACRRESGEIHRNAARLPGGIFYRPVPEFPGVAILCPGTWEPRFDWYRGFLYAEEEARGLDGVEDLFTPGAFQAPATREVWVSAGVDGSRAPSPPAAYAAERRRREGLAARVRPWAGRDPVAAQLARAADQFLIRPPGTGRDGAIIAGYPWFGAWGRDTFIALPGLCLATGRLEEARDILRTFATKLCDGLIPNFISESGEPDYHTADASLWFIQAARAWWMASAGRGGAGLFLRRILYPACREILARYAAGTRFGIRQDDDGLILAGEPGWPLTWMDARVGEWVVTPRSGKPVEIQALWHAGLLAVATLAAALGDRREAAGLRREAARVKTAFRRSFWLGNLGYLADVVAGPGGPDATLRPNQIFAVSLPGGLLSPPQRRAVVRTVADQLLLPGGLRTLSPGHPDYRGRYGGDRTVRDAAYHQGTAWPWLLGPFCLAYLNAHGRNRRTRAAVGEMLGWAAGHLSEAGLGSVSELLDGDPPHTPRGCPFQAWSVAEILRVLWEERLLRGRARARSGWPA